MFFALCTWKNEGTEENTILYRAGSLNHFSGEPDRGELNFS